MNYAQNLMLAILLFFTGAIAGSSAAQAANHVYCTSCVNGQQCCHWGINRYQCGSCQIAFMSTPFEAPAGDANDAQHVCAAAAQGGDAAGALTELCSALSK